MNTLIEALQSGKYEQNFGAMRTENKFCCLGVACEVYRLQYPDEYHWEKQSSGIYHLVNSYMKPYTYGGRMPMKIAAYHGFGDAIGSFEVPPEFKIPRGHATMLYLNDTLQWSFKRLANFLKSNPKFKESNEST